MRPATLSAARPFALALPLAAGALPARAGPGGQLEAEGSAAIAAALPSGAAARFRGLGAWIQEPGNASVCGEMRIDAGPDAVGQSRDGHSRAFFAARGTTGGWQAASPQSRRDGWRFSLNPTDNTAADDAACRAEMNRAPVEGGATRAPDPDILRRCPVDAAMFWIDHQMTCAGHTPPD